MAEWERTKVSAQYFKGEVQRRAYLIWETRMRSTEKDDWLKAQIEHWYEQGNVSFLQRPAYYIWEKRVNATPDDDWLEAERQIKRHYEIRP